MLEVRKLLGRILVPDCYDLPELIVYFDLNTCLNGQPLKAICADLTDRFRVGQQVIVLTDTVKNTIFDSQN